MSRAASAFFGRLFTLACAISLLLGLATCVFWARSYWYISHWEYRHYWNNDGLGHGDNYWAFSDRGALSFSRSLIWTDDPPAVRSFPSALSNHRVGEVRITKSRSTAGNSFPKTYGGFGYARVASVYAAGRFTIANPHWAIVVPYWAVVALFVLPPSVWILVFRRARKAAWRLRHVRCMYCGYDLRASAGRCPECGKTPAAVSLGHSAATADL